MWANAAFGFGNRKNNETGEQEEYPLPRFEKYIAKDFSRLKGEN